jgi:hypothetical protein
MFVVIGFRIAGPLIKPVLFSFRSRIPYVCLLPNPAGAVAGNVISASEASLNWRLSAREGENAALLATGGGVGRVGWTPVAYFGME